jgi:hypothetical protein
MMLSEIVGYLPEREGLVVVVSFFLDHRRSRMSAGIISGVNCTVEIGSSSTRASVRTYIVLAETRHAFEQRVVRSESR